MPKTKDVTRQGSTNLSPEQFSILEDLAAAGLGAPGIAAEIAANSEFSNDEANHLSQTPKSKGGVGGGKKGGSSGGEWGTLGKLLPIIKRGDKSSQDSNSGVPYAAGTTLNPTQTPGATSGGPSGVLLIGGIAVVAIGAWYYFTHKKKGK
jgi:hypothetical protein